MTVIALLKCASYMCLCSSLLHSPSAEIRKDTSSQYQSALLLGDVEERVKILKSAGQSEMHVHTPLPCTHMHTCTHPSLLHMYIHEHIPPTHLHTSPNAILSLQVKIKRAGPCESNGNSNTLPLPHCQHTNWSDHSLPHVVQLYYSPGFTYIALLSAFSAILLTVQQILLG